MNVAIAATLLDGSGTRKRPRTPIRVARFEPVFITVDLRRANSVAKNWADFAAQVLTVRTSPGATAGTAYNPTSMTESIATWKIPGASDPASLSYDIFVLDGTPDPLFVTAPADLIVDPVDGRPGAPITPPGPDMVPIGVPVDGAQVGYVPTVTSLSPFEMAFEAGSGGGSGGALKTFILPFVLPPSGSAALFADCSLTGLGLADDSYTVTLTIVSDGSSPISLPYVVGAFAGMGFRVQLNDYANQTVHANVFARVP